MQQPSQSQVGDCPACLPRPATSLPESPPSAASSRTLPAARRCSRTCWRMARVPHAAHVALAPPGDAAVHPLIFANDFSIELVALAFFLLEQFIAPVLEGREALARAGAPAAVEPNSCPRRSSRKRRSWLMSRRADRLACNVASSHSMALRSRWFVGSSSNSTSGLATSTRASATRRASPPESRSGSSSPESPRSLIKYSAAKGRRPGQGQPRRKSAHRAEPGEICFLRQIADAGARMREALATIRLGEAGGNLQKRRLA